MLRMNTAAVTKVEPGINAGLDFILNLMQKSIEILPTERDKSVHAPIAVFDSGVGGLTVARHIRTLLPQENLLYFADCAWTPYGPRGPRDIMHRVMTVADSLIARQPKALVVACNTATTLGIAVLRKRYPHLPIVGVEPGVQPALRASRIRIVGILATQATLDSPWFDALLARQSHSATFIRQPGHGLVELIERGMANSPEADALLHRFLMPMCEAGADTLVLGSTHFPLLVPAIERCVGNRMALIDKGPAVAQRVATVIGERTHGVLVADGGEPAAAVSGERHRAVESSGVCHIYSSAPSEVLATLAQTLLGTENRYALLMTDPPPKGR